MNTAPIVSASKPDLDGQQYHLKTKPGDLPAHCLIPGSKERALEIAESYFTDGFRLLNEYRGLTVCVGKYRDLDICTVASGMGDASIGVVLPEAARCGVRRFCRVGSCSTLWEDVQLGDSCIASGAVRLESASNNWVIPEYPAYADYRMTAALVKAAEQLGLPFHEGIEATTTCFNEGQARPDDNDYIPERLLMQHRELIARGVLHYSMESATLFTWCSTHWPKDAKPRDRYWAGSVSAAYGNRITDKLQGGAGDDAAIQIALQAMWLVNQKYPI